MELETEYFNPAGCQGHTFGKHLSDLQKAIEAQKIDEGADTTKWMEDIKSFTKKIDEKRDICFREVTFF